MPETLLRGLQLCSKRDPGTGVSFEFCEISKNTFFTEHLWRSASVKAHLEKIALDKVINGINNSLCVLVSS